MSTLLSRREMQVAKRISLGMSAVAVARDLAIGYEGVRNYLRRIRKKLGLHSQRDIRMFMLQQFHEEEEYTLP